MTFNTPAEDFDPDLSDTVEALIALGPLTDVALPRTSVAVAAALLCSGIRLPKRIHRQMRRVAFDSEPSLREQDIYFFDFRHPDPGGPAQKFSRDYFIFPIWLLGGIAGLQRHAPSVFRLRAEALVLQLLDNLRANGGLYKPDQDQRVSAKNQAWSAMLLHAATHRPSPPAVGARLVYEFFRRRRDTRWSNAAFLVAALTAIALNALIMQLEPSPFMAVHSSLTLAGVGLLTARNVQANVGGL